MKKLLDNFLSSQPTVFGLLEIEKQKIVVAHRKN